jgi:hypothetical protein
MDLQKGHRDSKIDHNPEHADHEFNGHKRGHGKVDEVPNVRRTRFDGGGKLKITGVRPVQRHVQSREYEDREAISNGKPDKAIAHGPKQGFQLLIELKRWPQIWIDISQNHRRKPIGKIEDGTASSV